MAKDEGRHLKLEVRDLVLDLRGRRVLDGLDMEVREGETLCVVGPSGAGKSMLLRTLVRLTEPTGGSILLDGRSIEQMDVEVLRRSVNMVQQQPAMLEGTVEENLRFGPELAGVPEEEIGSRIRDAIADASLDERFLARRADRLSGGERQRVAIARAHAMRPEVLLLDEPTTALDPRTTRSVEDAIVGLKKTRKFTMVIVTHDVEQSQRLGDRTMLLRRGKVVAVGESKGLIDRLEPEDRARYLGELKRPKKDEEEDGMNE
jgi:putative ABC transport system ATP-binding protein